MVLNLQILRAVAAWAVVLHHLREPMGEIWAPLGETLIFASGVDLFFVLSGFVMVAGTSGRDISPLTFWRRRAARVIPLYWLVTLALIAMLFAGLAPIGIQEWNRGDIAAAFSFIADQRSDGYPGPLLAVGWTLTYEAAFYALFGLALFARHFASPALIVIALLTVLVITGAVLSPQTFAAKTYLAPILLEFAAGAALGLMTLKPRARTGFRLIGAGAGALVLGGVALTWLAPSGDLITPGGAGAAWRTVLFGGPAVLIVAGAVMVERAGRICRSETLLTHGAASYAIYLTHLIVLQITGKLVSGVSTNPVPEIACGLIAVAFIGLATHKWVEAPLTDLINGRKGPKLVRGFRAAPFPAHDSRSRQT